ncbi:MAG: hypothetical protein AABM67_19150 [Acidobacteriota bacterium]
MSELRLVGIATGSQIHLRAFGDHRDLRIMTKTISYRLLGLGKIHEPLASQLKAEGILLLDEGIRGSATYINFRAPGKASNWLRRWFTASIALTRVRLWAQMYAQNIIDVPVTDERLKSMQFSIEGDGTLLVAFDASLFHSDWSGRIEYRFQSAQARAFLDKLGEAGLSGAGQ